VKELDKEREECELNQILEEEQGQEDSER